MVRNNGVGENSYYPKNGKGKTRAALGRETLMAQIRHGLKPGDLVAVETKNDLSLRYGILVCSTHAGVESIDLYRSWSYDSDAKKLSFDRRHNAVVHLGSLHSIRCLLPHEQVLEFTRLDKEKVRPFEESFNQRNGL